MVTDNANNDELHTDNGILLQRIDKFYYLGNMLDENGDVLWKR